MADERKRVQAPGAVGIARPAAQARATAPSLSLGSSLASATVAVALVSALLAKKAVGVLTVSRQSVRVSPRLQRVAPSGATPPTPLTITSQPTGGEYDGETAVTLTVAVTGSAPISYQWQSSPAGAGTWSNITGATSSSYDAEPEEDADYRCNITNPAGTVTSDTAQVTVPNPAPDGHVLRGTFRFANNYASNHTSGDIADWSSLPAVDDYAYNPDTGEYIRFTWVHPAGLVSYSRGQLGSAAAAISSATIWNCYTPE